jgi:DNA-binding response OmpR family regulator
MITVKESKVAKILIIEDDPGMRRTVSRILASAGHEVIEAPDGLEGMDLFRRNHPDIVVTDIIMPNKEGIETIRDLRQEHPSTLILAISGGATNLHGSPAPLDYLGLAEGLGADGVLAKPFRAADLLQEIDNLLGRGARGTEGAAIQ